VFAGLFFEVGFEAHYFVEVVMLGGVFDSVAAAAVCIFAAPGVDSEGGEGGFELAADPQFVFFSEHSE